MTEQRFEEIKVNAFIVAMALINTIKERQSKRALLDKDIIDVVNGLNGVFKYDDVVFTSGSSLSTGTYKIFIDSTDLNFEGELLETGDFVSDREFENAIDEGSNYVKHCKYHNIHSRQSVND